MIKNGIYSLMCDDNQVGYRLVTQIGVFDASVNAVLNVVNAVSPNGDIKVQHIDGMYLSNKESNSGENFAEVTSNPVQIRVLLNQLGVLSLPLSIRVGTAALKRSISSISDYAYRYCFKDIQKFLDTEAGKDCNVLALFGVRRTGKTVLMEQSIKYLLEKGVSGNKIAYLTLHGGKRVTDQELCDISHVLLNNLGIDYLFIDEFTFTKGDLGFSTIYSDVYTDKKVILSGTNSLAFAPLFSYDLFDRVVRISTTYISYKEYSMLFDNNVDLMQYIKRGSILNRNTSYDAEHRDLKGHIDASNKYLMSAIKDNLFGAISRYDAIRDEYPHLTNLYFQDKSRLEMLLNNWLQNYGTELTIGVLEEIAGSSDLSTTVSNLTRSKSIAGDWKSFKSEMQSIYLNKLSLINKEYSFKAEELSEIKKFLTFIDCYVESNVVNPRRFNTEVSKLKAFLLPVILRYSLLEVIISVIDESYGELAEKYGIELDLEEFKARLLSTAEGKFFEDVIDMELIKRGMSFKKYRDGGEEIDLILDNNGNRLFEIKLTDTVYLTDLKWLTNKGVLAHFNPIDLNILCNIKEDDDVVCTEYDVLQALEERRKELYPDKVLPAWLIKALETADKETKHTIHYRNASKFLREL